MEEQAQQAEEVTRTEVRPGLVMVKRRNRMPDGRYLLYFDFERPTTDRPDPASANAG